MCVCACVGFDLWPNFSRFANIFASCSRRPLNIWWERAEGTQIHLLSSTLNWKWKSETKREKPRGVWQRPIFFLYCDSLKKFSFVSLFFGRLCWFDFIIFVYAYCENIYENVYWQLKPRGEDRGLLKRLSIFFRAFSLRIFRIFAPKTRISQINRVAWKYT